MMKKHTFFLFAAIFLLGSCGMLQSIMKSTFPYTANLVIPASSSVDQPHTAISTANSFDQDFTKDGNNANRISEVRIISAKLQSKDPSDYNIGNIAALRIYMAKADGSDEVLVAIRKDITANVGNSVVLDIDNSHFLDEIVREPSARIRMVYLLRKAVSTDVELKVSLSIGAEPRER
ncbi:hypothetical protein [Mucilaginibacter sp. OK283]|jgi:hypothetical protein|uniref:hypothetical protein n=1 Tax=Mucilaginibacter sp. OK283 TaxID=1881049 RepID=UPI00115FB115|nr:hypothetical protein [Mucilaginibacter sp. OK283]